MRMNNFMSNLSSKKTAGQHPGDSFLQSPLFQRLWPLLILAGLGLFLYAQSYEKWGDLIIDLGHNLYLPDRLLAGDLLYRDILYNFGPVTPYVLAAVVWLFGSSLMTFEIIGLLIGILVLTALFRSGMLLGGRPGAFSSSLLFLVFSFFACSTWGCNFVLPYSFAATLSTAFSCWAFYFLLMYLYQGGRTRHWWWGVACTFAAVFTKVEVGVAILGVYILACLFHRLPLSRVISALFFGIALCCLFVVLFTSQGGRGHSLFTENIGRFIGNENAGWFYSSVSGIKAVGSNMIKQVASSGKIAVLMLLGIVAGRAGGRHPIGKTQTAIIRGGAIISFGLLVLLWGDVSLFAAIPPAAFVILGYSLLYKQKSPLLLLSAFVLFSSLRILFNFSPEWYGFYLAIPAYLLLSYFLGQGLLAHQGFLRWLAISLGCLLAVMMVRTELGMWRTYSAMTSILHTPKGNIRDFPTGRAEAIEAYLEYMLQKKDARGATAVVFPEGVTLNYFADLVNPTSYYSFIPPEIGSPAEEQRMLEELRATPPDYVIIVDRDLREFGYRGFGIDYALGITGWIQQNYGQEKAFRGPRGSALQLIVYRKIMPGEGSTQTILKDER
jgi:hypothetical protein